MGTRRVAVLDVECLGNEMVRASALRRSHVLVDGLVDEAVGEAVAARPTGVVDDDTCREGRFEVIEERRTVHVEAGGEDGEVEGLAEGGGERQRSDRRFRESLDALADDTLDAVRDRRVHRVAARWMFMSSGVAEELD